MQLGRFGWVLLLCLVRVGTSNVEESLKRFRSASEAAALLQPVVVECELASSDAAAGTNGRVRVVMRPDWAPHAAAAFVERVRAGFYDGCRFFRVLPKFVAQVQGRPGLRTRSSRVFSNRPVSARVVAHQEDAPPIRNGPAPLPARGARLQEETVSHNAPPSRP